MTFRHRWLPKAPAQGALTELSFIPKTGLRPEAPDLKPSEVTGHYTPAGGEDLALQPGGNPAFEVHNGKHSSSRDSAASREPAAPSTEAMLEIIQPAPELQKIPVEIVELHAKSRLVCLTDPASAGADRFRYLRMRLREHWNAGKLKTLLITSPLPGDGKSTIARNLATMLAEGGKKTVLLVEADLHRPSLSAVFGLQERTGFGECLELGLNPMAAIRRLEPLSWYFLGAGKCAGNAAELMQIEALAEVMERLKPHFDWILFDSPPVVPFTATLALRKLADASLLVVRAHRTPSKLLDQSIGLIGREHIAGIVLNDLEDLNRLYYKYYGSYGRAMPAYRAITAGDENK